MLPICFKPEALLSLKGMCISVTLSAYLMSV